MLRKDKLYRPCKYCNKPFKPTSHSNKLCRKCSDKSLKERKKRRWWVKCKTKN